MNAPEEGRRSDVAEGRRPAGTDGALSACDGARIMERDERIVAEPARLSTYIF